MRDMTMTRQPAPTETERWVIVDDLEVIADVDRVDELYATVMWHARVWDRRPYHDGRKRTAFFAAYPTLAEAKAACESRLK